MFASMFCLTICVIPVSHLTPCAVLCTEKNVGDKAEVLNTMKAEVT